MKKQLLGTTTLVAAGLLMGQGAYAAEPMSLSIGGYTGLGRRNVLNCIATAQPKGMIAVPLAHAARKIFPKAFKGIELNVTVGRRWFWGGTTLNAIRHQGEMDFKSAPVQPDDPAAILFTSGSTGPSKGVLYSHRMFYQQVELLRRMFGIEQGEMDLPTIS